MKHITYKNNVLAIKDRNKIYDLYIKNEELETVIKLLKKACKM